MKQHDLWLQRRQRIFSIIEIGNLNDWFSRSYDLINTLAIVVNLTVSILFTYEDIRLRYSALLTNLEIITVLFFTVDYALRVWTARFLHPNSRSEADAIRRYVLSFTGIIDLLSFLPYYLPVFFPAGAVAFRMFRVARIFRLFRINAYYDSLNVISEVIASKRQQLVSSLFILVTLMVASSLCMYSLEHEAQPEVFTNAFSGIWWSVSTLLTVGYGDIYPITTMGKFFSIVITFLGVGMVAIPTGIISAGFVDQYSHAKQISEYAREEDIRFLEIRLGTDDAWVGWSLQELSLPHGMVIAAIQRKDHLMIPRGNVRLQAEDTLILAAEGTPDNIHVDLKEITLRKQHPWTGLPIRELEISRQSFIVMIRRDGKTLLPRSDLQLQEGDTLLMYTRSHIGPLST